VLHHFYEMPVVEPGAPYGVFIDPKAEPPDEVERTARCCAETRNIARIRWNFGLNQNDMKGALDRARA
jgi:hypothetical protein